MAAGPLWLYARLVSWVLPGTGHPEIAVDLEVVWLSNRCDSARLVSVLSAPPCLSLDWYTDIDGSEKVLYIPTARASLLG